jgi:hypothetical protein
MPDEKKVETEEKADAGGVMLDKILKGVDSACSAMDSMSKRMDAFENRMDAADEKFAKKDSDEEAKRVAADKRKDSDKEDEKKADADDKDEKKSDAEDDKDKDEKKDSDKDEKKSEEKSDSAEMTSLKAEMAGLKARMTPRSDDDHRLLIGAQAKFDSVYQAFGDSAPRFLDGETLSGYRRRLASDLKKHSSAWKTVDLAIVADDTTFGIAEDQILKDSMAVAMNPTDIPAGQLREIKSRDATGREWSSFYGRSGDWMGKHSGARRRAIINSRPNSTPLN